MRQAFILWHLVGTKHYMSKSLLYYYYYSAKEIKLFCDRQLAKNKQKIK